MRTFVVLFIILIVYMVVSFAYTMATRFTKVITIRRKKTTTEMHYFNHHNHREKDYYVVSSEGEKFEISDSIWLRAWDKEDLWTSLQHGKTYTVTGYGQYIKMLDMHRHIVRVNEA